MKKKTKIKRYDVNKAAKVGETIVCPVCGKSFVKKSYQQAFCCCECKDKYHNQRRSGNGYFKQYNIDHPERLNRIGINVDMFAEACLGDPEWESLAQITLDKSCIDEFYEDW